jgi:hypothetical protein
MARKQTKKQLQNRALRKIAKEGAFTTGTLNRTDSHWFRSNNLTFDYNDENNWRAVIDAQHARALAFRLPTASQMGYGEYDLTVRARPALAAADPFDTTESVGTCKIRYVEPTITRMNALREMIDLEILDDKQDMNTVEGSSDTFEVVNPLLVLPQDTSEQSTSKDVKTGYRFGNKIVRYGFSSAGPDVKHQSSFTKNLNPHTDSDVSDNYESQKYCLLGGDADYFGVLARYEDYLNPIVADTQRMQEEKWAYPMTAQVCEGVTEQYGKLGYAVNGALLGGGSAPNHTEMYEHTFRGIRATGGLIEVTVPDWYSHLETGANNDFQLEVILKTKKWVPMA